MQAGIISNEVITQTDETLNDLPVPEDHAQEAKGGIIPMEQISLNYSEIKPEYKSQDASRG